MSPHRAALRSAAPAGPGQHRRLLKRLGVAAALLIGSAAWQAPAFLSPTVAHADAIACNLTITIITGDDGLRADSIETIRLGGQALVFDDTNQPYHHGGTDARHETLTWHAQVSSCPPGSDAIGDFQIEHDSTGGDTSADNWDLQGLRIVDRDTGTVDFEQYAPPGRVIHRFQKNSGQIWTTGREDRDTDGDGLTDRVEMSGIRNPVTGAVDTWLPDQGADPCRKTVAVEIDWLEDGTHSDRPADAALEEARTMFANAPVPNAGVCPYGGTRQPGIQLLTDLSNAIRVDSDQRVQALSMPSGSRGRDDFTAAGAAFRRANFTPGREGYFFYSLWGHTSLDRSTYTGDSGLGPRGNDFVVTLGNRGDPSVDTDAVTVREQSGTFAHELGHVLGLRHGGGDDVNDKPNYLSIMNYTFQTIGLPDYSEWNRIILNRPDGQPFTSRDWWQRLALVSELDYSRKALYPLHKSALNERAGLNADTDTITTWCDNTGTHHLAAANAPIDWDWSGAGTPDPNPGHTVAIRPLNCPTTGTRLGLSPDQLTSYNDWQHIKYRIGVSSDRAQPLPPRTEPELTKEQGDRARAELLNAAIRAATSTRAGFPFAQLTNGPKGDPVITSSRNSTGGPNEIGRTRTGVYTVFFAGVQDPTVFNAAGAPLVRTLRPTSAHCQIGPYGAPYRSPHAGVLSQYVSVFCYNSHGQPTNAQFTVSYMRNGSFSGHGGHQAAYVVDSDPAAAHGSPILEQQYDSAFATQTRRAIIDQPSTGRYLVTLPRMGGHGGTVRTSAVWGTGQRDCRSVGSRTVGEDLRVTMKCVDGNGDPAQSMFTVVFER